MDRPKKNLTKVQKIIRQSSSGRTIKMPKALLTTSSEEAPRRKNVSASLSRSVKDHIKQLKNKFHLAQSNQVQMKTTLKNVTSMSSNSEPISKQSTSSSKNVDRNTLQNVSNLKLNTQNTQRNDDTANIIITDPEKKNTPPATAFLNLQSSTLEMGEESTATSLQSSQYINKGKHPYSDLRKEIDDCAEVHKENCALNSTVTDFNAWVENELINLKCQCEQLHQKADRSIELNEKILKLLIKKSIGREKITQTLYELLSGFPMCTVEEFQEFENNEEKLTNMYDYLQQLGGTKLREFLNCVLKTIISDELVCHFNCKKCNTAEEFGNTVVSNILYEAAQNCPLFMGPQTIVEYNNEMQEVLRATKQRYRKGKKHVVSKENSETGEDEFDEDFDEDYDEEAENRNSYQGVDADTEDN